jgi:hypothetical protein
MELFKILLNSARMNSDGMAILLTSTKIGESTQKLLLGQIQSVYIVIHS